ncbi:teichoic acid transporter [Gardnerella swidsinskii]|uniref:teichoic acid transporter n=1 Tax=Gardnerella swidsinskii TaxID=2792979 RepID=UPI0039EF9AF0
MKLNDEHDGEYPQSFAPLKPRKRSARVINANEVLKKNDDSKSKIPDEYVNIGLPETDLSIADFSRKHSNPKNWWIYFGVLLVAIVIPYWIGRTMAARHTSWVISHCSGLSSQGVVFISWVITVSAFTSLAMALIDTHRWIWRIMFAVFLALEQLIAGLCMLNMSFWYSTYVVYGHASGLANAANLGIISAGIGVAVFAVIFVGLLVIVPKTSALNVLTRSWASFIMFYAIEVLAILVVLFGGFITAM